MAVVCVWESIRPKRKLTQARFIRWPSNLGIVALNTFILRVIFPTTAVGFGVIASKNEWGVFNQVDLTMSLKIILSVIILDLAIYLQHMAFHLVPVLWRLHRMHHADLDFDVTTGARFHPIEIILSMGVKFVVIGLIGIPAAAVLIFEVLLNATAMFNHGNIFLPAKVDQWLRLIVVTPDMHRIHHSIYGDETNSNFGFNLPWWDRIFQTYCDKSKEDQKTMTIGINLFREKKYLKLHWLLAQPFLSDTFLSDKILSDKKGSGKK